MGGLDGEALMPSMSLARSRAVSGALDQVFSSIGNGVIIFAVAVVSSPQDFGHIAILMTALVAVVGCLRGALGTPLLLKADQSRDRIRSEGSYALASALVVGPLLAVAIVAFGADLGAAAVYLGVASPFVLAQDVLRYVAIAEGRPYVAAVWDGVWCAGSIALLILTWVHPEFATISVLLAGWGLFAVIACIGLLAKLSIAPRLTGSIAWLKAGLRHRIRYGVDAGLEQVTVFVVLALIAALTTTTIAAALRGATALLAPIGLFGNAIQLVVIPESTRRSAQPVVVWRVMMRIAIVSALVLSVSGAILVMLPSRIGFLLLGETWDISRQILPVTVLEYVATCFAVALAIYLRTFNRSADALSLRIAMTVAAISGAITTAVIFHNAVGVACGLAIGGVLVAGVAFALLAPSRSRTRAASVDIAAIAVPVNGQEPRVEPMGGGHAESTATGSESQLGARWPVVLASLAAALVVAGLFTAAQPRGYSATAIWTVDVPGTPTSMGADRDQRARAYLDLFAREDLAQNVIDWLGLAESPPELVERVTANADGHALLVTVSVEDDAHRAANIANAYGAVFDDFAAGAAAAGTGPNPAPLVTVVRAARADDAANDGPSIWEPAAIGLAAALAVGVILARITDRRDRLRRRGVSGVRRSGAADIRIR
ncbi:hypothetical protein H7J88_23305 [Mycolicibacterium flavescens]|uniref:Uncharacterized protein n=1 Tax=Mycolicibacterium flavescens TaxID=1776 RepID=A0A1E3RJZ4_MYCFV|nr:hypothetical protein [Mycolicibacterium flavescens]MCV7282567.1 hypothetical protein [Mycolicibacterium flavescens]ODQ90191.1 hypothetical protein BHQ18_12220 [Mycolicibacterium flavescens]